MKGRTNEADGRMLTWVETQKKLKWRQALRIATQSQERWTRKAAEWKPALHNSTKTQRRAGRPARRWGDDLNDFVKDEATEATQSNDLKNDTRFLAPVKNAEDWKKKDNTPNTPSTTSVSVPNTPHQQQHYDAVKTKSSSSYSHVV